MKNCPDVKDVKFCAGFAKVFDCFVQPAFQIVAVSGVFDLLIVFHIVQNNHVRAVGAVFQAAHALTGTAGLNFDVISGNKNADFPS